LNESVSGHGAEPVEWTIGDCLEYFIGFFICISCQRLKPMHTLDPSVALSRFLNFFWARWGLKVDVALPTKAYAIMHVVVNLGILSYVCVGTHMLPMHVDDTDIGE